MFPTPRDARDQRDVAENDAVLDNEHRARSRRNNEQDAVANPTLTLLNAERVPTRRAGEVIAPAISADEEDAAGSEMDEDSEHPEPPQEQVSW